MASLTRERLAQVLSYEPTSGRFVWLAPSTSRAAFLIGKEAGRLHKRSGYREIGVDGKHYLAHRLAWFYAYGAWPAGLVDHINGDKSDNRLDNLRPANYVTNGQNRSGAQENNALGLLGVSRNGSGFRARIKPPGGKCIHLGTFRTQEEAVRARNAAKTCFHQF